MKKIVSLALTGLLMFSLAACSTTKKDGNSSKETSSVQKNNQAVSNGSVSLGIVSGEFIQPAYKNSLDQYLAVNLEFGNESKQDLRIATYDLTVYDSANNKVEMEHVMQSSDAFKRLEGGELAANKKLSGNIVFKVEEGKTYEIQYIPRVTDSKEKDVKKLTLQVKPSDFPNKIKESQILAEDLVAQVFFDQEAKSQKGDFVLGGDLKTQRAEYRSTFTQFLKKWMRNYPFAEGELDPILDSYIKVNAKKAKVTYQVETYLPDLVEISIRPETVNLDGFSKNYYLDYYNKNGNPKGNMVELYKDADQALAKELVETMDSRDIAYAKSLSQNGYRLKFIKNKGKWTLDKQGSMYGSLVESFSGNLS